MGGRLKGAMPINRLNPSEKMPEGTTVEHTRNGACGVVQKNLPYKAHVLVRWQDGTETWAPRKELREPKET
jgi:hypothetical protein